MLDSKNDVKQLFSRILTPISLILNVVLTLLHGERLRALQAGRGSSQNSYKNSRTCKSMRWQNMGLFFSHHSAVCPLFLKCLLNTALSTIINSMTDATTITTTMAITATIPPLRDEESPVPGKTEIDT